MVRRNKVLAPHMRIKPLLPLLRALFFVFVLERHAVKLKPMGQQLIAVLFCDAVLQLLDLFIDELNDFA